MLYHHKIGFPTTLTLPRGIIRLKYGPHARSKRITKLPELLYTGNATPIEIETDKQGKLVKVLYRLPYDVTEDLLLAVQLNGFVRTAYLNSRYDNHTTLNSSKYNKP